MLIGKFQIDTHSVIILFYINASNGLISTQIMEILSLWKTPMEIPMVIDSLGGRIELTYVCTLVILNLRGIGFPSKLIV